MLKKTVVLLIMPVIVCSCKPEKETVPKQEKGKKMDIEVTSSAFGDGELIPATYTADGRDISPPLAWSGAGEGTKSIALINDDPDAPMGTWVHWVVYNLPADATSLEENIPPVETLPNGAKQGTTDFGKIELSIIDLPFVINIFLPDILNNTLSDFCPLWLTKHHRQQS